MPVFAFSALTLSIKCPQGSADTVV